MIQVVNGEIYNIDISDITDELSCSSHMDSVQSFASAFFKEPDHKFDLLSVHGINDNPIYISSIDAENHTIDADNHIPFTKNLFTDARRSRHLARGGIVPALNSRGEPVCLLKVSSGKSYYHKYKDITEAPDTRVFDLYDAVVMTDVTEYAFILLNEVLCGYKGRIVCIGPEWQDFTGIIPHRDNIEFIFDKQKLPPELIKMKTMYLMNFFSKVGGYPERCKEGLFSYDEIMGLVYMFSIKKPQGEKNPSKRYLLVDPVVFINGLMTICSMCSYAYSYAKANGFIPVLHLTHSHSSIYVDHEGEDIWEKFFLQPYGEETSEWKESQNVYQFPENYVTHSAKWLMDQIISYEGVNLVNTLYINDKIKNEVKKIREEVLPNPEKTIGVLIRGTDYTITHLPGHQIMATPEQVMEKVEEIRLKGDYDRIFLSTEDLDILEKMKELCGDKLSYIEYKRFRIKPNELLADQKKEREHEGWLRGKEYLVPLQLLSECGAFVASGHCGGTECVLNTNKKKFKDTYVFELGTY